MKFFFILIVGLVLAKASFLRDNANGVVLDTSTNLMWQDVVNTGTIDWLNALKQCSDSTLASYTDWRLPNVKELLSIVNYNKHNPCVSDIFLNILNVQYWTSTTTVIYKHASYKIHLGKPIVHFGRKGDKYYSMCVRTTQ